MESFTTRWGLSKRSYLYMLLWLHNTLAWDCHKLELHITTIYTYDVLITFLKNSKPASTQNCYRSTTFWENSFNYTS